MIILDFILALFTSLVIIGIIRLFYYYSIKYLFIKKLIKKDKKSKFNYKLIFKRTLLEKIWVKYKQFQLKTKK